jgi:hypothetical protein
MTERDRSPKVPDGFVSASHAILFESESSCCSVCTQPIENEDEDEDSDAPASGRGLLIWARGDERRYEEPQLCPSCASAIGVTALQRWEIEEDEG